MIYFEIAVNILEFSDQWRNLSDNWKKILNLFDFFHFSPIYSHPLIYGLTESTDISGFLFLALQKRDKQKSSKLYIPSLYLKKAKKLFYAFFCSDLTNFTFQEFFWVKNQSQRKYPQKFGWKRKNKGPFGKFWIKIWA